MRKTCLFLLLAPLVVLPVATIRRGSVIPNTIYRPSQTSSAVENIRSGTVIDREAADDGDDSHARRYITLDEEDEDEEETMGYGASAAAEDVLAHLNRIHRAVGEVFPQTDRALKPMQRVNNLSKVQRSNSQRDPKNRVKLLYLGIDPAAQVDDEASYEVVSPMGFQFSRIVGIVVPRTERELQRQVAYMTGRYSQGTQETAVAGADHYQMTREMRDTIRMARNGVIAKYGGMTNERLGEMAAHKRQTAPPSTASGRPAACSTDIRQCPEGQGRINSGPSSLDYTCVGGDGRIADYTYSSPPRDCYSCTNLGEGEGCQESVCRPLCKF